MARLRRLASLLCAAVVAGLGAHMLGVRRNLGDKPPASPVVAVAALPSA